MLRKCPRCDLNYITEKEKYCKVCLREMRGKSPRDEVELCSICNEQPVIPGRDVCIFCQREMSGRNMGIAMSQEDQQDLPVDQVNIGDMDDVSSMDEMLPEIEDSQDKEYGEMANQLSLESVREEEENAAEQDEMADANEE